MKKLMFSMLAVSSAYLANASILYWQVSASDYTDDTWNQASLFVDGVAVSSQYYVDTYNNSVESIAGGSGTVVSAPMGSGLVYDIGGDVSGHSYFVELYNSGTKIAYSQTYSDSSAAGLPTVYANTDALVATLSTTATLIPWHAGSYTAVPEPTSAMLMLFGAAFLGLKRKNRSLA